MCPSEMSDKTEYVESFGWFGPIVNRMDYYIGFDSSGLLHILWRLSNGRWRHVVDHPNGLRERMVDVHNLGDFLAHNQLVQVPDVACVVPAVVRRPAFVPNLGASVLRRHLW